MKLWKFLDDISLIIKLYDDKTTLRNMSVK